MTPAAPSCGQSVAGATDRLGLSHLPHPHPAPASIEGLCVAPCPSAELLTVQVPLRWAPRPFGAMMTCAALTCRCSRRLARLQRCVQWLGGIRLLAQAQQGMWFDP